MKPTIEEQRSVDEGLAEIVEARVAEAKEKEEDRIEHEELEAQSWAVARDIREMEDEEELREAELRRREAEDDAFYIDIAADWFEDALDEKKWRRPGPVVTSLPPGHYTATVGAVAMGPRAFAVAYNVETDDGPKPLVQVNRFCGNFGPDEGEGEE